MWQPEAPTWFPLNFEARALVGGRTTKLGTGVMIPFMPEDLSDAPVACTVECQTEALVGPDADTVTYRRIGDRLFRRLSAPDSRLAKLAATAGEPPINLTLHRGERTAGFRRWVSLDEDRAEPEAQLRRELAELAMCDGEPWVPAPEPTWRVAMAHGLVMVCPDIFLDETRMRTRKATLFRADQRDEAIRFAQALSSAWMGGGELRTVVKGSIAIGNWTPTYDAVSVDLARGIRLTENAIARLPYASVPGAVVEAIVDAKRAELAGDAPGGLQRIAVAVGLLDNAVQYARISAPATSEDVRELWNCLGIAMQRHALLEWDRDGNQAAIAAAM